MAPGSQQPILQKFKCMIAKALIKRDSALLAQPQTNILIYSEVAIIQTNMLDNFSKYIRLNHHCTSECIRKFV